MNHSERDNPEATQEGVAAEPGERAAAAVPIGIQWQPGGGEGQGCADAKGGHKGSNGDCPVPRGAPAFSVHLAPVFEGDRAEDQRHQDAQERKIERREQRGVPQGESCERGSGCSEKPHLVAVPDGADGIEQYAPVRVVPRKQLHEHAYPEIKALQEEVAGPQYCDGHEPDGWQQVHGLVLCF